jgi:hypothetical protein
MYSNYFIYNEQKYYTGTVVQLKRGNNVYGAFICHDVVHDYYFFKVQGRREGVRGHDLDRFIITVTEEVNKDVHMPVQKTYKDSDIDGLALGWVWYIFLMAISTIFKGNVCFWIVISVLFFAWRKKIIKEKGTYYEW